MNLKLLNHTFPIILNENMEKQPPINLSLTLLLALIFLPAKYALKHGSIRLWPHKLDIHKNGRPIYISSRK